MTSENPKQNFSDTIVSGGDQCTDGHMTIAKIAYSQCLAFCPMWSSRRRHWVVFRTRFAVLTVAPHPAFWVLTAVGRNMTLAPYKMYFMSGVNKFREPDRPRH